MEAVDLGAYQGQSATLILTVRTDADFPSTFLVDDVSLNSCYRPSQRPWTYVPLLWRR